MPPIHFASIQIPESDCWAICAALMFMVLDFISGFAGAVINGKLSSTKMREGIGHKMMLVIVIIAAVLLQVFSSHIANLGFDIPSTAVVCVYIVVMELTSVIENVVEAYPGLEGTPLIRLFEKIDEKVHNDTDQG